jgi:hypothetical protein
VSGRRRLAALTASGPALAFLLIYGPAVGRGFISDDFGWIAQSRVSSFSRAVALFAENHGFYRPLVALSFAADYALFGMNARGFGWTNFLLAVACGVLVQALLRSLGMARGVAWFGAAVWLLNFHGINMALLWISGRTALLAVLGSLAAALGAIRGRPLLAVAGLCFALLSKEEALVIPLIWVAVYGFGLSRREGAREATRWSLVLGGVLVLAAYAIARSFSGAMTPGSAPVYYRFTFAPAVVTRNALEYADRACTFAAAVTLLAWVVLRSPSSSGVRPAVVAFGAMWILAGYAITVWLPVRSSLYACLPSVGAVVIACECCQHWWGRSTRVRQDVALAAVAIIPVLCVPAYVARNHRWTDLADLSTACLRDIDERTRAVPAGGRLVLVDDRSERVNLQSAFGTLIGDAVALHTHRTMKVWVEPPLDYAALAGMEKPCPGCESMRLTLRDGRLR